MKRAKDEAIAVALAQCTDLLRDGLTVRECLARYPQYAAELTPLLQTVAEVRQQRVVPARSPAVVEQRRAQFMLAAEQAAAARSASANRVNDIQPASIAAALAAWWQRVSSALFGASGVGAPRTMPIGLAATLLVVFLLGFTATGVVDASNVALPGDPLFSVKLGLEDVRLFLTRDPAAHAQFEEQRAARRRDEAKTIADTGREVNNIELRGVIEELRGNEWQVGDLTVLTTHDTVIIGNPVVGASVSGTMKAPGDHTLVAVYVEIEPPAESGATPDGAARGQMVPSQPSPAGTPTGTPEPTSDPNFAPLPLATGIIFEPTDAPTSTATPRPTPTATRTLLPTATATSVPTATATLPAPARERQEGRIIGFVTRIEGGWWTIDEVTVETDGDTKFFGNPDIGSKVEVIVRVRPNGSLVALEIHTIGAVKPTPEPWEFTGIVETIDGDRWTISGARVRVTGDTVLEENPVLGDTVTVKAQLRGGEIWALRIRALREVEYNFQGTVDKIDGAYWEIAGARVLTDGATQFNGDPTVGSEVQVEAVRRIDGQLYAKSITVISQPPVEPIDQPIIRVTVTPTVEPTREPTATPTTEPAPAPATELTGNPTMTPTAEPTAASESP